MADEVDSSVSLKSSKKAIFSNVYTLKLPSISTSQFDTSYSSLNRSKSPSFEFANSTWRFLFCVSLNTRHIRKCFCLKRLNNKKTRQRIFYRLLVLDINGQTYDKRSADLCFSKDEEELKSIATIDYEKLTHEDTLIVHLICHESAEESPSAVYRRLDTLSENFKNLFANEESCDTTLRVGDSVYKVHKAVLIARSSVFAAMFLHDMSEKQTGIITILDCDAASFKEFLEYLYCGELKELSFCSAINLYETSNKYDVQELKEICIEFLIESLATEGVCDVVILADKYDDMKLTSAIQDFFSENINKIFRTPEWECLMKNNYRLANKLLMALPTLKVVK